MNGYRSRYRQPSLHSCTAYSGEVFVQALFTCGQYNRCNRRGEGTKVFLKLKTNEAPPQTDKWYWGVAGLRRSLVRNWRVVGRRV